MTDPDPAATLSRLLCVLTPAQFAALTEQIVMLAECGYGEACIRFREGQADLIRVETSVKIREMA